MGGDGSETAGGAPGQAWTPLLRQLALSSYLSQKQEMFLEITGQAPVIRGKLGLEVSAGGGSSVSGDLAGLRALSPPSQWSPLC